MLSLAEAGVLDALHCLGIYYGFIDEWKFHSVRDQSASNCTLFHEPQHIFILFLVFGPSTQQIYKSNDLF